MLVFSAQKLAFIAVPKTGTTAIEMALRPRADIIFGKHRKHMTARRFHSRIAPFLADVFDLRPEVFAVMRDPEEQIRSWYRYRRRDGLTRDDHSTDAICFDRFVLDVIADDPPPHAGIGSQWNMLTGPRDAVLVTHLFAYESQPLLLEFLRDRFGEVIVPKRKNVSPPADAPLSPEIRDRLRASRAREFALYDRLRDAGGHLRTAVGEAS
ncbi:hypothetical protein [Pukyongiella litopenaei]|uniref:Gamma-glutamyl kinase n=1 Tax=Pukyongiella litopenaei TaxID=2605946 RepID=A0A2S0MKZ3_9RHOB|nr:hypothetical protein [Pukyongiella litopenaei]AVO36550.1 hypothetical protein C6Y53_01760 [Pukyongiella litopenaei]